jgi:hypothetical protein
VTIRPDTKHLLNCKMHCSWRINDTVVRDHKGLGCNVALIKCTLGPGKPKGGWDFGREGTRGQMGNKGSQFTSNLGLRWTIPVIARRVPSK